MRLRKFLSLSFLLLPIAGLFGQAQQFELSGVVTAGGKTMVCLTEQTTGNFESRWLQSPGGVWEINQSFWQMGKFTPAPPTNFKVSTAIDETKSRASLSIATKDGSRHQILYLKDALVTQTGPQPVRPIINNPNNQPPDPPQTIIVNGKAVTVQPGQSVDDAINKAFGVKKKTTATSSTPTAPAPATIPSPAQNN